MLSKAKKQRYFFEKHWPMNPIVILWVYLSFFFFSWGIIFIEGSFKTFLLAILSSKVSNKEGNNSKLETIASNKVMDTKPPKAIVPPKLDTVNTKNPKKSTMEV